MLALLVCVGHVMQSKVSQRPSPDGQHEGSVHKYSPGHGLTLREPLESLPEQLVIGKASYLLKSNFIKADPSFPYWRPSWIHKPLCLGGLSSGLVWVDLLAILVVSDTRRWCSVSATFAGSDTRKRIVSPFCSLKGSLFQSRTDVRPRFITSA